MPIYEYHCEKCGDFDVMQKITAKPLRKCPTCKSKVKKLISNTAFQLKGTGWYVTDYGGKSKSRDGEAGSAKPTSSSSDGGSADGASSKKTEKKSPKGKGESAAA